MKQYLVIGLGRFGRGVAQTLYDADKDVLGIEVNEELVQECINNNVLTNAVIGDATDIKLLKDLGAENYDIAFVCMAEIEPSVMITLNLKDLGVKKIIAKASTKKHGEVLMKVGATKIVYPEEYMGRKIAELSMDTNIVEYLKFTEDFILVEVKALSIFWNKSLIESDIRNKYKSNVVGIKKKDDTFLPNPVATTVVEEGDTLLIITDKKTAHSFEELV
ncbi:MULTISPECIES: potassium channel family protein [Fusobacterium]|uniref:potassium channel family protein n=1 Tax=Fusobacterium TaxID=848 RepID=UPI001F5000FE|nr:MULTISPECIES: TrkA family potassium uptake protein [Fusobacterium]MDD7392396.1 TrkA family potassium uptake protein [Fusobacteriaceae bacterium]MCI5725689.1 TrkA family potassium uptake protein [Fusobacterium sp.]MCI7224285.1 TrkA family potassium uptake protein [Fusobacterium sp.]MDD7409908.1 TrkA family potassium uptake protein [Fusobacteriaceae bacterium]MDY5305653.1 TrkA family potassium uptake protein [Fusobacterium gastrosuis]